MDAKFIFRLVRTVVPFLLLLIVVYLIASSCAISPDYYISGGWSGTVWIDHFPDSTMKARLHIHAHITHANAGDTDPGQMREDTIPLSFWIWPDPVPINGHNYLGKYYSSYSTAGNSYAAGTWTVDSAYVDDGKGGVWENKIVKIAAREIARISYNTVNHNVDTLDFTQ